MIKKLLKGYGYAASSSGAATIKDADGLVLCQLTAGKQGYFIATTNDIDVGTSDVEVVQVRGTSGGCSGGGGGGVDPTPYIEEIERLEAEIEILEGQITELEAEVADLEAEVEAKAAQIAALNEQITGLQAQIATLESEIEDLEDEVEQKDAQITTLQARVAELEASIAPLLARIAELEAALTPNSVLAISDAGSVQPFFSKVSGGVSFSYNSSITEWSYQLTGLVNGNVQEEELYAIIGMFEGCSNLTEWTVALPDTLQDATCMFRNCSGLTSFSTPSGALPNSIRYASNMFSLCFALTSWNVELSNVLQYTDSMFGYCSSLTSFSTPSRTLPNSITNASYMFNDCSNLTSFNAALPNSLSEADFMFYGCKLNKASVQNIVDTIPTWTSGTHMITIGVDSTKITQAEQNAFNTTLVGKGWRVTWQRK